MVNTRKELYELSRRKPGWRFTAGAQYWNAPELVGWPGEDGLFDEFLPVGPLVLKIGTIRRRRGIFSGIHEH